jgi:putative ABC transport system permease protein
MNLWTLIRRSLAYHRSMHLAVLLGVIVAGTVLTGALLIGDSMRGSLRGLVLERLGLIDQVLIAPRFFRMELADELVTKANLPRDLRYDAKPAIYLQASFSREGTKSDGSGAQTYRTGEVQVLGIDFSGFSSLGDLDWIIEPPVNFTPTMPLDKNGDMLPYPYIVGDNEIIINEPLADALGLTQEVLRSAKDTKQSFDIVLRVPRPSDIPPDSALGRKTETTLSRRLTVVGIARATGIGRFGLQPTQELPKNAWVNLATLQNLLKQPGLCNMLLVPGDRETPRSESEQKTLDAALQPTIADAGLKLTKLDNDVWQVTSDTLILDDEVAARINAWAVKQQRKTQPSLVYLANWIEATRKDPEASPDKKPKRVPYSTVAAIDFEASPASNDWRDIDGKPLEKIGDDEIVVNQWVADDLKAQGFELKPGDEIKLTYFEPESTHGEVLETRAIFKLRGIVPMEGPATDRQLTPELPGVTDKKSLANWDPPFPYDPTRVRSVKPNDQDEVYWEEYKATPKAFVNYNSGVKAWSSRFGKSTALRFAGKPGDTAESLAAELARELPFQKLGLTLLPVKAQGLDAAAGTTPFDGLFLGFSMFLIVAAILLIAMLFKLGLEQRARELGIERAVGFSQKMLRRQYLTEGSVVAIQGSLLGALGGIAFATLMLWGLRTWWIDAIRTPFLSLHITLRSLSIGIGMTFLVAVLTMLLTLRGMQRANVRQLLAGQVTEPKPTAAAGRWSRWSMVACAILAVILIGLGSQLGGEAQAGAFFGSGAMLLTALVLFARARLRHAAQHGNGMTRDLVSLAWSNAARAPTRSVSTLALVGMAVFLLVAISAFQLQPPPTGTDKNQGDGGFALWAASDLPIYPDLANKKEREEKLSFADLPDSPVDRATIIPLRVESGQDASCLNLYQATRPRIVGVNARLIERGGFAWAALPKNLPAGETNPWKALEQPAMYDTASIESVAPRVIPVVLDQNTAMYSLHLYSGVGERFAIDDGRGGKIQMQVAGLLKNSLFQGDLLVGEQDFKHLFPQVSGSRLFLIAPDSLEAAEPLRQELEETLESYGFLVSPTQDRLRELMAVQNTYLSTFQSLGGLGLLLGTIGLAVVQWRNIWERRGELSLLRAIGFTRERLRRLLLWENLSLLLAGLLLGVFTALVAISPSLWRGDAGVPWLQLLTILGVVVVTGVITGWQSARAALAPPIVETLRSEGN